MIELLLLGMAIAAMYPVVRFTRPGPLVWPARRSWFDIPHE